MTPEAARKVIADLSVYQNSGKTHLFKKFADEVNQTLDIWIASKNWVADFESKLKAEDVVLEELQLPMDQLNTALGRFANGAKTATDLDLEREALEAARVAIDELRKLRTEVANRVLTVEEAETKRGALSTKLISENSKALKFGQFLVALNSYKFPSPDSGNNTAEAGGDSSAKPAPEIKPKEPEAKKPGVDLPLTYVAINPLSQASSGDEADIGNIGELGGVGGLEKSPKFVRVVVGEGPNEKVEKLGSTIKTKIYRGSTPLFDIQSTGGGRTIKFLPDSIPEFPGRFAIQFGSEESKVDFQLRFELVSKEPESGDSEATTPLLTLGVAEGLEKNTGPNSAGAPQVRLKPEVAEELDGKIRVAGRDSVGSLKFSLTESGNVELSADELKGLQSESDIEGGGNLSFGGAAINFAALLPSGSASNTEAQGQSIEERTKELEGVKEAKKQFEFYFSALGNQLLKDMKGYSESEKKFVRLDAAMAGVPGTFADFQSGNTAHRWKPAGATYSEGCAGAVSFLHYTARLADRIEGEYLKFPAADSPSIKYLVDGEKVLNIQDFSKPIDRWMTVTRQAGKRDAETRTVKGNMSLKDQQDLQKLINADLFFENWVKAFPDEKTISAIQPYLDWKAERVAGVDKDKIFTDKNFTWQDEAMLAEEKALQPGAKPAGPSQKDKALDARLNYLKSPLDEMGAFRMDILIMNTTGKRESVPLIRFISD